MATTITAKGDLLVGTGSATYDNLAVGTDGYTLVADSSESTGIKWAAPAAGGGLTLLDTLTLTGSSVTSSTLSTSHKNLVCVYKNVYASSGETAFIRFNSDTGNNYATNFLVSSTSTSHTAQTTSFFRLINLSTASGAKDKATGVVTIYRYTDTDQVAVQHFGYGKEGGSTPAGYYTLGVYDNSAAITTISFILGTATFSAGTVYIYGQD
jgi:hypothetical protein